LPFHGHGAGFCVFSGWGLHRVKANEAKE
jgi:hypothetical protein